MPGGLLVLEGVVNHARPDEKHRQRPGEVFDAFVENVAVGVQIKL